MPDGIMLGRKQSSGFRPALWELLVWVVEGAISVGVRVSRDG